MVKSFRQAIFVGDEGANLGSGQYQLDDNPNEICITIPNFLEIRLSDGLQDYFL